MRGIHKRKRRKWIKVTAVPAALIAVAAAVFLSPGQMKALGSDEGSTNLTTIQIVHTNDIHGRSGYAEGSVVGFDRLASFISQIQADLVLDAGDTFHGQAFATLEQGEGIAQLMKAVGYDAMTPGNHDWNYGKDRVAQLADLSDTKILAANVLEDGTPFFGNDGTLIKDVNGVKVGVLGVFDPDIRESTAPRNVEGLMIADDAKTASSLSGSLREQGCDVVIALSHQLDCENFIKRSHGIDVLIAGHEHMVEDKSYPDADGRLVKVVETGAYFEHAGLLTISYDQMADEITDIQETLLSTETAGGLTPAERVSDILTSIHERQKIQLGKTVGMTGLELDGTWETLRIKETGMGRLVTAAYLQETGADVAFENAGGIRLGKILPSGKITFQDIIDTAPYGNYIVTKQITGEALLSILEHSIEIGLQNQVAYDEWLKTGSDQVRWPNDNGNYLQFGGLNVFYDPQRLQGNRITEVLVNGEPLNKTKLYTVATNNYISLGKTYPELADAPELNQYGSCDEALQRFIEQGQEKVDTAAGKAGLREISGLELPDAA